MASAFAQRERALNEKLFGDLVQRQAELQPQTENFSIALQFCLQNTAQHTYLDPNPSTVSSQYKELLQRLEINSQLRKADALKVLTAKFQKQPLQSFYPDVNASVLSLLYHLADAPASTPLDFEPKLFEEPSTELSIKDIDDSDDVDSEWSYDWSTESDLKSDDGESVSEEFPGASDEEATAGSDQDSPHTFDWKTYSLQLDEESGPSNLVEEDEAEPNAADLSGTLVEAISRSRGSGLASLQPNPSLRTTEAVLVRQVLRLLQGTVQSAFCSGAHRFQLIDGVHVTHLSPSSLRQLLAPFLVAASSLKHVQDWIAGVRAKTWQSFGDERRQARGPTMEAFANALRIQVQSLMASVVEAESEAARGAAGTQVTLLSLRQRLRGVLQGSRFLEMVLDAVTASETGNAADDAEHLLSVLYQLMGQHCLLEDGEEAAYRTVLSLFLASLQPMLTALNAWLEEGILQDAANELFICANPAVPIEDSAFWLLGHSLRRRHRPSPPQTPEARSSHSSAYPPEPATQPLPTSAASTPTSPPPEDDLICPPFLSGLAPAILRTGKSLQLLNHVIQDPSSELARPSAGPFPRTSFPFSSPSKSPFRYSAPPSPGLRASNPPTPPDTRSRRASLVSQLPSPSQRASPLHTPLRTEVAFSPRLPQAASSEPIPSGGKEEFSAERSREERRPLYHKFCDSLRLLVTAKVGSEAEKATVLAERTEASESAQSSDEGDSLSSLWAKSFVVEDWAVALQHAAIEASEGAAAQTNSDAVYSFLRHDANTRSQNQNGDGQLERAEFLALPPLDDADLRAALGQETEAASTSGRGDDDELFRRVPGNDYANAPNGGALVVDLCKLDAGSLMQRVAREPTWLPRVSFGVGRGDELEWLRKARLRATPPPAVLIQECLLKHIGQQVDHVGARLLARLMGEWQLIEELAILRAVYLLGSGDVLHQFTTALFAKLERREPWDDFHELNTMLQNSVRASGDSALSLIQDSLLIRVVDPEGSDAPSHRPVLRSFGIDALDCLRFSYKVSWPLELIISEAAIHKYNQVMAFLLKLKRAKHGLDRAARWKINGLGSSGGKQRLLFQQKLLHFINTLHQYVMDRVLHSAWLDLRTEMAAATSLDEVIACHERYLAAIQKQCLVASDKLWTLLASRVRTMVAIALDFCSLQRTLSSDGANPDVLARGEAEMLRLERQFHESMVFLLRVLSSKLNVGHFPHLADLVIRINYNHYYMNEQGRILLSPASASMH
ncbi:Spc97 / Spc98 family of spindle pole body component [Klebsormidium nitens]|uniref:Spc97 / Spc98 family of spindle pole body component n=1 Tax=Klebsormidium nitens TaxID=105231 RepID=A0A1Y1HTI8_KLENI|nr:Spc97 / Spc98 family of spindle pole body component [Klebsormidium nitens]|eukprot:GAQ81443.1 Spc97 / Spc98 family of spindle pole body component [Klebsormidium nitens]